MAHINVILLERVAKLGHIGDVVAVKAGFARNFLLPQKKALRATESNKKIFESQRAHIEAQNLERKNEAEKVGKALEGTIVVLIRQAGDSGQLYGSVSSRDIAEALAAEGRIIDKNHIALDKPIKTLGIHDVRVQMHAEVRVSIRANVARSKEEAALQAKGVDVLKMQAEEDARASQAAAEQAAAARAEMMEEAGPA